MIDLSIIDRVVSDSDKERNRKKILDLIAKAEGADYDTIVGGSKFQDFSKHPNIVGLRTKEGPSTAAGRYQITGTTYRDVAGKHGISDFSPASQDAIALRLIERAGALDLIDKGDFSGAINKLGRTWASLPSSPYSQPKKSDEWVANFLADYDKNIATDMMNSNNRQKQLSQDVIESGGVLGDDGFITYPDGRIESYSDYATSQPISSTIDFKRGTNTSYGKSGRDKIEQAMIPQALLAMGDYYGPMINVPANPSKKSSGKPIDEKAIEKEKKKLSDKIAESMVAPLRQPASTFEMPRSRIGLAMIQDRLDDINNPNRRSRMADNTAFTGMTSEDQMQQALSAKEDEYRTMVDRFNAALGLQRQKLSTQESDMDRAQQAKAFALKALEYKYDDPMQQAKMQDLEDDRKIKLIQILSRAMGRGDKAEISPTDVLKNRELLVGDGTITEEQASAIIRRGLGM